MMDFNTLKLALENLEEEDILSDDTEHCTEAMGDWNWWLMEAEVNDTITGEEYNQLVDVCYNRREALINVEGETVH